MYYVVTGYPLQTVIVRTEPFFRVVGGRDGNALIRQAVGQTAIELSPDVFPSGEVHAADARGSRIE